MEGIFDWFSPITPDTLNPGRAACMNAPPSAQVKALSAKSDDIQAHWNPTGYYTADQMRQVIGATMNLVNQYHNSVMTARQRYDFSALAKAEEAFNEIGKQAVDYTTTYQKAQKTGAAINAPGLKMWVVNATRAMNEGMRAVEQAACDEPWWFGAISTYTAMFDVLKGVVMTVAGIVVKAGQIVLDAVETTLSLWPFVKWGAIGVGAIMATLYVWNKLDSSAQAGRRSIDWSKLNPIAKIRGLVQKPSAQISGHRRRRRRR